MIRSIRAEKPKRPKAPPRRKLALECLEDRRVMATLPFGATSQDTGEFMLGRIAVTPVFLESTGAVSTEDWTPAYVEAVMGNIQTGLQWWNQLLAKKSSLHTLEWVIDRTYVDNRLPITFEPINMTSEGYLQWGPQFLQGVGFNNSPNFEANIRSFNNSQRTKLDTDWSFTIFVVNAMKDIDGSFAPGGSFSRAFAFAGGLFEVIPSSRPNSTYTHETGHIFWARDEYSGGGNYYDRRGYYNAQNTNAVDLNPTPNFQQQASIMSSGSSLTTAFNQIISPDATLAQIGWQDSDNDGIFDVLDVPLKLEGTGRFNPQFSFYSFSGRASVQTLPNRNSSGTQNDITLNKVRRIEYRIDAGNWTTIQSPNAYTVYLNLQIPILPFQVGKTIEIRAVETRLGITSNIFTGIIGNAPDVTDRQGIQGFVWRDTNKNGQWDSSENGIPNATVTIV
ncbi:MAG: protein containing Planctomycete extracellular domain protein, partial [Planctomycetota bacterium]